MVEQKHLSEGLVEKVPCPATKRNGEVCGSTRITASGHCFAHHPEAAKWRAMGGSATSSRRRMAKRMEDAGVAHLFDMLEEDFYKLSENITPANVRMMAKLSEVMLKIVKFTEKYGNDSDFMDMGWEDSEEWTPY